MKSKKVLNLYPIDYPFETLVSRAKVGKLILNPEFQRKYKWDVDGDERASRFIESCLMRIPLPACYFAEDKNKNHLVIDGVQRITTIIRFLNDEFALEGLTAFKELDGKKFSELGDYKNDIENYTIRCVVLRNDNEKDLIQDIFARLNQGSVLLSAQEIRHAVCPGKLDDLLTELSKIPIIQNFGQGKKTTVLKNSLEPQELVLRFFAMAGDLHDYEDHFSKYLDKFMNENQNISKERERELRLLFENTLKNCIAVFDERVFVGAGNKSPTQSYVYYDLLMWALQGYDDKFIKSNKTKLNDTFSNLCNNPSFKNSLTGKLLRKGSILRRRKMWKEEEDKVFGK